MAKSKKNTKPPAKDPAPAPRRMADVTPERRKALSTARGSTSTLAEMLTVDLGTLAQTLAPSIAPAALAVLREGGFVTRLALAGKAVFEHAGDRRAAGVFERLAAHESDMARAVACFMITADEGLSLKERLARIRPLADDAHSGVREWAWMAVRPAIAAELGSAMKRLATWTAEASPNLRRFASEATRPRGVWCAHLRQLRDNPAPGAAILEPLRADPHKYVQDSVGNWLNDAGKDRPEWVSKLCRRWQRESDSAFTARIVRRAMRNL